MGAVYKALKVQAWRNCPLPSLRSHRVHQIGQDHAHRPEQIEEQLFSGSYILNRMLRLRFSVQCI